MKGTQRMLAALLIGFLLASAFLLEGSTNSLFESATQAASHSSQSSHSTASYGGLRVSVAAMDDSSPTVSHLPITIRRGQVPTDNRLLLYAARGGPVEVELPANSYYLVEVSVPLFPVAVRVRVLGDELTILKISVNELSRRASSFELEDTDSTGRVTGWGKVFISTGTIETPERLWNTTMLLLKSDRFPPAPYSDVRLIQSELTDVSILGIQKVGGSVNLQLRPVAALHAAGISSVFFLAFASNHSVSYSTGWTNSDHSVSEPIQDGPPGG